MSSSLYLNRARVYLKITCSTDTHFITGHSRHTINWKLWGGESENYSFSCGAVGPFTHYSSDRFPISHLVPQLPDNINLLGSWALSLNETFGLDLRGWSCCQHLSLCGIYFCVCTVILFPETNDVKAVLHLSHCRNKPKGIVPLIVWIYAACGRLWGRY